MPSPERRGAGIALFLAGITLAGIGWLLAGWLAGSPAAGGKPLAVSLVWGACCVAAVLWAHVAWKRREARDRERLRVLAGAADALDPVTLVERLAADRDRADRSLRTFREDFDRLRRALETELEGTGEPDWPGPERLGELAAQVRLVADDRREDARSASELLGLWIQRLELMQARVADAVRSLEASTAGGMGLGERVTGTGGGREPLEPTDSLGALLSQHLEAAAAELKQLEASAGTLRRRLGGEAAAELTEEDFVG